jgi:hypothetical protein
MATTSTHISHLPVELIPTKSSTQLINEHITRLLNTGVRQKVIALTLGFGTNYVSMLKAGEDLPLPRIVAFAHAVRLNEEDRRELLHTRLIELHGSKGEICVETLAQWADDLFTPVGDEWKLIEMWREATSPAPHLLGNLLDDPVRSERVHSAMNEVVQAELKAMADEAVVP